MPWRERPIISSCGINDNFYYLLIKVSIFFLELAFLLLLALCHSNTAYLILELTLLGKLEQKLMNDDFELSFGGEVGFSLLGQHKLKQIFVYVFLGILL